MIYKLSNEIYSDYKINWTINEDALNINQLMVSKETTISNNKQLIVVNRGTMYTVITTSQYRKIYKYF